MEFFPFKNFDKKVIQIDSLDKNHFVGSVSDTKIKLDQFSHFFNFKIWFVTIMCSIIAILVVTLIVIYFVNKVLFVKIKNKLCCKNFFQGGKDNKCKTNCGKIFRASGKWSCIKNTMRILPKNSSILIDYLFHYLSDSTIFPKRGSGQPFIGQQDAREIAISFPSVAEQQKIIDFVEYSLSRLDSSMKLAEQMENQAVVLRRSLLHAAFTGQLTNEVVSV